MFSVFAYGTLQLPIVIQSVIGRKPNSVAATLAGHQCLKFKDKTYPGIIKNKACSIEGMLYKEFDERTLQLLDQFEDSLYERCLLDVQVDNQIERAVDSSSDEI
jgi:gamma-glutamylcyclotransferase (GGCT)/AIG2-like uncharacterized protein YtfP